MPLWTRIEKTKPEPERVTMDGGMGPWKTISAASIVMFLIWAPLKAVGAESAFKCGAIPCDEFTANWDNDGFGWTKVKDISYLLKPRARYGGQSAYEPAREAQAVLREFCPQMDKLVLEAKERDRINGIEEAKNKSSSGGIKVNCDSPVWKNKPRCN